MANDNDTGLKQIKIINKKKAPKRIRLTQKEKEFASQNHDLIYTLMRQHHIPIEEYYGEAAYGYLKAVIKYHRQPKLRQYCFSTIAGQSIRCYCNNEIDSRKRYAGHIECSMNKVIDAEGNEWGDFRRDTQDSFREFEDQEDMKQLLGKILPRLTRRQQKHLIYLLEGYKPKEIREKLKSGYITYQEDMETIGRVVLSSCTGATGQLAGKE